MNIPNIITLGRILLVPFIVWAIASNQMEIAFAIFVIAGVSDAVDGFLAKNFNMTSELGALLDPVADKALLVSIYVALGIWGAVPRWIVILVVSRDIMIVGAVIVSWLYGKPIPMKPLMVSKLNTVAQVAFAALVLGSVGFGFDASPYDLVLMGLVTIFTLLSVSFYLVEWARHMSTVEALERLRPSSRRRKRPAWSDCVAGRVQPRQLAFALPHAESLSRDNFLEGPANAAGTCAGRELAGLAQPGDAAGRPRGFRQKPPRRDLGRGGRRPPNQRTCADTAQKCPASWRPARWWSRISGQANSTSARCSIC